MDEEKDMEAVSISNTLLRIVISKRTAIRLVDLSCVARLRLTVAPIMRGIPSLHAPRQVAV